MVQVVPKLDNYPRLQVMQTFRHRLHVTFGDTDASSFVHFANYFRYFERAEDALYRTLRLTKFETDEKSNTALPRGEIHCRYLSPCTFGNEVEVEIWVETLSNKSVKYGFSMRNITSGKIAAEGWVTAVTMNRSKLKAVEVPKEMKSALAPYVREATGL